MTISEIKRAIDNCDETKVLVKTDDLHSLKSYIADLEYSIITRDNHLKTANQNIARLNDEIEYLMADYKTLDEYI